MGWLRIGMDANSVNLIEALLSFEEIYGWRAVRVLVVDPSEDGERVCAIYGMVNPDKLTRLAGAVRERSELMRSCW
jgi:hypothetical protein